jgi:hypothetical protein
MRKYLELVEGSFTQEHFDKQESQNPYVAYSIQDVKVIFNIVKKVEEDKYLLQVIKKKDISNCTYNMVDLGLPSGTKWADRYIGAEEVGGSGAFFQWGDTNAYVVDGFGEVSDTKLAELLTIFLNRDVTKDTLKDILGEYQIVGNDLTTLSSSNELNKKYSIDKILD